MFVSSQDPAHYYLPPKLNYTQIYGYLDIIPTNLVFTSVPNQNLAMKIYFWGMDVPHYLYIDNVLHFDIVAINTAFKQYLIDTRITKIEIVDSRNYKCIAITHINWLSILRSINDQTVYKTKKNTRDSQNNDDGYHLPFYDQEVELNLDLHKFNQKQRLQKTNLDKTSGRLKVGEIKVRISSRINVKINTQKNIMKQDESQIRVSALNHSQDHLKKINVFPASRVNIETNNNQEQYVAANQSFMTNKSLSQTANGKQMPRKSAISIRENFNREKRLTKVREQESYKQFPSLGQQNNIFNRGNLDLQLMRVRMQMEDLVGMKEKQKMITISIKYFESLNKLQSKAVPFIDVVCQTNNSKYRLYPKQSTAQNKVQFDSCLIFQRDSKLTCSVTIKKQPKDKIVKGELSLNLISQNHQLSLLSSQGILEGVIHIVKISNQTHQQKQKLSELKYQLKSNKREQSMQQISSQNKKPQMTLIRNNQEGERNRKQQTFVVKQFYDSKPKQKQFYLFCIKEKVQDFSINYKIANRTIPGSAKLKFLILEQDQILGKQITISAIKNNSILQKIYLQGITKQIPAVASNLTCILIRQQFVPSLRIVYQLYLGSLTQVNYLVQQISTHQSQNKVYYQQNIKEIQPRMQQQFQFGAKDKKIQIQQRQRGNQMRKLKTQDFNGEDYRKREQQERRITTEGRVSAAQSLTAGDLMTHQQENQHNSSEHAEQADNQNIYLVDLMTRFLQTLSVDKLQKVDNIKLPQLVELALKQDGILEKDSVFKNQKELVEIVLSIFLEQANSSIDLTALKQSYQGYKTFKELYIGQIQKLMIAIKKEEPTASDKIRSNCQLGMINQRILWNRALPKVNKLSVRQRVSKFYRISHYGPTDAHFLIQDLQAKSKTELKELDISNLGILIRESVEKYLFNINTIASQIIASTLSQTAIDQHWINIRGLDSLFETIFELKISLWESLMLIQEIKVCYGCDLQADQGIISVDSITEWITTVQNRPNDQQRSHVSVKENGNIIYQKQIDQKSRDNQSLMRNQNNDSQIFDIANLLRKREQQLDLYEKPENKPIIKQSVVISNSISKDNSMTKKQKDAMLLGQLSEDNVSEEMPATVRNQKDKTKILGIKINQIKLYQDPKNIQRVKIQMGVQSNSSIVSQNSYFYLSHFDVQKGQNMKLNIDCNQRPTIQLKILQQGDLKGQSGLVWEEYCCCFDKIPVRRTLVIYNSKGAIIGKIMVQLIEQNNDKIKQYKDQRQICQVQIQLLKPTANDNQNRLFVKVKDQIEEKQLSVSENVLLDIKEPIYYRELQIQNAAKQYGCLVPLQQLFLRRQITATYPLITYLNCTFVGNINLAIRLLPLQQSPYPQQHIDYQKHNYQLLPSKKTNEQQLQSSQINAKIQKIQAMMKKRDKIGPAIEKVASHNKQEKEQVIKRIDNIYKQLKAKFSR